MQARKHIVRLFTAGTLLIFLTGSWTGMAGEKKTIKNPKADTPYFALLEGLKLIKAGKYDEWVEKWCHKQDLCKDAKSISTLKKYNIMMQNRLLNEKDSCLKGKEDTLIVTRTMGDPQKAQKLKIFLECKAKSMPRPYTLKKEGQNWRFERL